MSRTLVTVRRSLLLIAALLPLAACGDSGKAMADAPRSFAPLVEHVLPGVVNISTSQTVKNKGKGQLPMPEFPPDSPFGEFFKDFQDRQGDQADKETSLGSGFVIDPAGYIVTNNHVIDGADAITVKLQDDTSLKATLVGTDKGTDIALLKVDPSALPGGKLASLPLGDSDGLRVGDWVVAIGNPFGLGGTVTAGIISARGRDIGAGKYDDFLQTDAAINLGNSGGPLIDMAGSVIGINTAIFSPQGADSEEAGSVGIGFAIPSVLVKTVVQQLRDTGHVRRGWLGVQIQDVSPDIAETLGLKAAKGALVAVVAAGGPGEKGGLRPGDVIISVDGHVIQASRTLPRLVAEMPVGHDASVEVLRKGGHQTLKVALGELKDDDTAAADDTTPIPSSEAEQTVDAIGMTLDAATPRIRQKYGIKDDDRGVAVTKVAPGSRADTHNIKVGDLVVEVSQNEVATPAEVTAEVAKAKAAGQKAVLFLIQRAGDLLFVAVPLE